MDGECATDGDCLNAMEILPGTLYPSSIIRSELNRGIVELSASSSRASALFCTSLQLMILCILGQIFRRNIADQIIRIALKEQMQRQKLMLQQEFRK